MRIEKWGGLIILVGVICLLAFPEMGWAAEGDSAPSGGYLAGYEEADPRPAPISGVSTLAYLLSLFAVFAFVMALAYFATRLIGRRFNQQRLGNAQLLSHLPLGPKQFVCVVELADRVLVLGVTEQTVNLLAEISDPEEVEQLHRQGMLQPSGQDLFSQQFGALSSFVQKVPPFRK